MQVSVVIPTYNRVKDLNSCLDSIIVQTTLPKEVLVIDNGTDTNTSNLIEIRKKEFKDKGIILDYIKNPRENSLTIAKNIGVKQSTGDIISFLDDDLVLDKDYYKEIIKVYKETPNSLGVTGHNQSGKGKKRKLWNMKVWNILGRLHLTTSFTEKNKCRVYPSLTVSYPPSPNKIINCEWLSGASTYKRKIFEELKYDEKLKKYSWGEDTDFSYRVFKKYSHSLFLNPHAKYIHKPSPTGRNPKREIIYMAEIYYLYLFFKIMDQSVKNKLIYLWSRIGETIYKLICLILKPSESKILEIKYLIGAYICCMKHFKKIKKGDLEFFNKTLK
jgi:GT2 family glycosyltransferase